MPDTLVSPHTGKTVESIEKQVEKLDAEIENMKRRKLITIVGGNTGPLAKLGPSDKVIYVEPLDLKGHDPEEMVDIIEEYVIETKYDNGFAQHLTGKRPSGEQKKRCDLEPDKYVGPFGPTYRIDTSNQNGEREFNEFRRTVEEHTNKMSKVPDPVPYHSDVREDGSYDLRNITITKNDVPVAQLENYAPLEKLLKKRQALMSSKDIKEVNPVITPESFICDICSKEYGSRASLYNHKSQKHNGKEE